MVFKFIVTKRCMIIAISGTPGTGKTRVAKAISKNLGYKVIEISKLIGINPNSETKISLAELNKLIKPYITDNTIIESHLAHFLTSKKIDFFIILRCNPDILAKRLKKRGYSKQKIYDNVMFEALDGTYIEAKELHKNVIQVDNTALPNKTVNIITLFVTNGRKPKYKKIDYSKYLINITKKFTCINGKR